MVQYDTTQMSKISAEIESSEWLKLCLIPACSLKGGSILREQDMKYKHLSRLCFYQCTRPIQKVSSHVIWKIEIFIEKDKRYKKHHAWDNVASVPFKVGILGPHTVLSVSLPLFKTLCKAFCWNHCQVPHRIFLNLTDGLKSLPFQRWF